MKIIFLDIDGVLNNDKTNALTPDGFIGIGNSLLDRLASIVHRTDAKIVLSTSWKTEWSVNPIERKPDGQYLNKKFKQVKICIMDKIDDRETGVQNRGQAILNYLATRTDVEEWVAIDDDPFDYAEHKEFNNRLVKTSTSLGLTNEDMEKAISILKGK